jgi:dimethylargininase
LSRPSRPVAALVREVSPRITEAELTFLAPERPIDLARARSQHAAYVDTLRQLGIEIVAVPPAPEHPDGVFVEDTCIVVDDLAVLTRPGAASRQGEVGSVERVLQERGVTTMTIAAPATLDGGDVLQVGDEVFVGRSRRTDAAGVAALASLLAPLGRTVTPIDVAGALHLKTAATALPDGTLVAVPSWLDVAGFGDRPVVEAPEPAGANLLLVGETVLVSTSAPRTAELVTARGFEVVTVDVSELERAEAGLTCLSVLLPGIDR